MRVSRRGRGGRGRSRARSNGTETYLTACGTHGDAGGATEDSVDNAAGNGKAVGEDPDTSGGNSQPNRQLRAPWAKCGSCNGLRAPSTPQAATATDDFAVLDFDAAEAAEGHDTHDRADLTTRAVRTSDGRAKTQAGSLTLALGEYSCACRCKGPRDCCVLS